MSELTKLDSDSLRRYGDEVEDFISTIDRACRNMQQGIGYCESGMQDEKSKKIISDVKHAVLEIIDIIKPATAVKEKIYTVVKEMDTIDTL